MNIRLPLLLLFIYLLIPYRADAQLNYGFDFSKSGSAGLQFLKIGAGARETALGQAVSSTSRDAGALFYNPAGIAYLEKNEGQLSHNSWLAESNYNAGVFAMPIGGFVVGVSAISLQIKEFEETTALSPDGTGRMVSAGDVMVGIGAARRFTDRLSIGANVKYVNEKLDDYSIGNVLFDIGAIYSTGFRDLTLGFALQHFGPDMKLVNQVFRTPLQFRVSASDKLTISRQMDLTGAIELVHPTDNREWVNYGLEANILNMVQLRAGYRQNVDFGKFSFGGGVIIPYPGYVTCRFDYSYTVSEIIFNDVQRISLVFSF